MLKKIKFIMPLVFIMSLMFSMTAFAAENFDASYYASKYPDVVAVYGTSEEMLYKHYVEYGQKEGRFKNLSEEQTGIVTPVTNTAISNTPLYPTYIDVSIDNQTLTYYENGVVCLQDTVVTGNVRTGKDTPKGTFTLTTHMPGKTLRGRTWNVWVDYWIHFYDGCGFHDATWRNDSEFGGTTYLTNGSHGCVNLRHEFAKQLFEKVDVGTIVVIH